MRMKQTTQNLESKLNKAAAINEEDEDEEEEITFDEPGAFSARSASQSRDRLDEGAPIELKNMKDVIEEEEKKEKEAKILFKPQKNHKSVEEKLMHKQEKAKMYNKLLSQLSEFKNEMFSQE
jgi:hypothetical protein